MTKKKKRISVSESSSESLGSMGDLLKQAGFTPSDMNNESEQEQADDAKDILQPEQRPENKKISVRTERKGRGGKTVTIVEGLHQTEPELQRMAKMMRKGLGCGASIEGGCIVLQGNQVDRATRWLAEN
jgi:translation initiation factor 1